jgi:site-specific recombinase XerD
LDYSRNKHELISRTKPLRVGTGTEKREKTGESRFFRIFKENFRKIIYNRRTAYAEKKINILKLKENLKMRKKEILERLEQDLELRGKSASTIKEYVSKVHLYQEYYGKPADELGVESIQEYLHYLLTEKKLSASTVNTYNSAFRFVYGVTLDIALNYKKLPRVPQSRRLPQIFTQEEVGKIIESAGNPCHKAMLMLAYGSGLRLSEITGLKVSDIESDQNRILIRHGKGDRDRYAMLPKTTLEALREYWLSCPPPRPRDWLFVSPRTGERYYNRTLQDAFKAALKRSGVNKTGTIHTLRHCFATHLYEDGHNLLALKKLLGHVRIDTTAWYTQLAASDVLKVKSPRETIPRKRGRPAKAGSK